MATLITSDMTLVGRTLAGDHKSFEALVQRHWRSVRAIAASYARDTGEIDDVVQESFVKAYASLDTLKDRERFGAWLASITRNTALRLVQKQKRESELKQAMADAPSVDTGYAPEERELFGLIRSVTDDLDATHREVLVLHYFAGHDCKYIASLLDISHEAVRKRLQRAREALSDRLLYELEHAGPKPKELRSRAKGITGAAIATGVAWGGAAQAQTSAVGIGLALAAAAIVAGAMAVVVTNSGGNSTSSAPAPVADVDRATVGSDEPADPMQIAAAQSTTDPTNSGSSDTVSEEESQPKRGSANSTGTMGGRILTPDGQPAAGAHVVYMLRTWDPHERVPDDAQTWEATADARGIVRVEDLPWGDYGVWVWTGDGFAGITETSLYATRQERFAELTLSHAATLTGTVVDSDEIPVADARILIYEDIENGEILLAAGDMSEQITDEEGRFTIPNVPIREWRILAIAEGHGAVLDRVAVDPGEEITIEFNKPSSLRGIAKFSDGLPPSETTLALLSDNTRYRPTTTVDEDGTFAFEGIGSESYTVAPVSDTLVAMPHEPVFVRRGRAEENIFITLAEGAVVHGKVVDTRTSEFMAGVRVKAEPRNGLAALARETVSGPDGNYKLTGLTQGDYMVFPDALDGYKLPFGRYQGGKETPLTVGANPTHLDVHLEPCCVVRGTVRANGEPVPFARVSMGGGLNTYVGGTVVADENGRYAIHFAPVTGDLWLNGIKDGLVARPRELTFTEPGTYYEDVELGVGARASGQVVDASGKPVPNARVHSSLRGSRSGGGSGQADALGNFTVAGLEPGTHQFSVQLDDGPYTMSTPKENSLHDFEFGDHKTGIVLIYEAGGTIAGRVVDSEGKPIVGASVRGRGSSRTSDDGTFTIEGIKEPYSQVSAAADDYMQVSLAGVPVNTRDLVITLWPRPIVKGNVVDAETGEPLKDFRVSRVGWDRPNMTGFVQREYKRIESDTGAFEFDVPYSTTTTFWADAPGYAASYAVVETLPGTVTDDVVIELEKGGTVAGRVVDESGQPVAGASIFFRTPPQKYIAAQELATTCDDRGEFSLERMPDMPMYLSAAKDGYSFDLHEVASGGSVTFTLRGLRPYSFQVLREGVPVSIESIAYRLTEEQFYNSPEWEMDSESIVRVGDLPAIPGELEIGLERTGSTIRSIHYPANAIMLDRQNVIQCPAENCTLRVSIANWNPTAAHVTLVVNVAVDPVSYMALSAGGWNGETVIENLPAGAGTLTVRNQPQTSPYTETEYAITLVPNEITELNIEL